MHALKAWETQSLPRERIRAYPAEFLQYYESHRHRPPPRLSHKVPPFFSNLRGSQLAQPSAHPLGRVTLSNLGTCGGVDVALFTATARTEVQLEQGGRLSES
jgi:hypothetical protein